MEKINIQSIWPLTFNKQEVQCSDKQISYLNNGATVTVDFNNISKISIKPQMRTVLLLRTYDLTIFTKDGNVHNISNISKSGLNYLLSKVSFDFEMSVEYEKPTFGSMIFGNLIRDPSPKLPNNVSLIASYIFLIILAVLAVLVYFSF